MLLMEGLGEPNFVCRDSPHTCYEAAHQLIYAQTAAGRTTYTFDAGGNQGSRPRGHTVTSVGPAKTEALGRVVQ